MAARRAWSAGGAGSGAGAGARRSDGLSCDRCRRVIQPGSYVFKCLLCPNYINCSACSAHSEVAHAVHDVDAFVRFKVPAGGASSLAGLPFVDTTPFAHRVTCDLCHAPIVGVRYLVTSDGINLCAACEHTGKYAPLEPRLKIPQARSQALAAAPATSPISVRAPTSSAAVEPRSPEELQRGVLDKWLRHSKLHAARQAFSGWKQAVPAGNQAPAQPEPAAPTASPALRRWADMSRRLQAYVKDRPYYGTGIYGYQTRSSLERDGIAVPGGERTPERWARMSRKVLHEAQARHARALRFHRTRAHDAGGVPSDSDSDEAEDQAALGRNDVASFMQRRRRRQQRDALRALAAARRQDAAPTAAHRTGADRLNSFVTRRALRAKQGAFAALASQASRRRQAAASY